MKVVADAREIAAADAIIFAVKMRDTEGAAESLRGLVGKGATVFTFQNGVESAERIGAIVGGDKVVPGVARIAAHITEPGVIKQIGNFARLEFGEADGKPSARTTRLPRGLQGGRHRRERLRQHRRELWMKFAMLAPLSRP